MKKYGWIVIVAVVVLSMGAYIETQRYGWSVPAAVVSTDNTLVSDANTTMKYANVPATAYSPAVGQNIVEISWSMGADAQSCVVHVFAARKNGDIAKVYTATLTAGKQTSTDSRKYVDTIASGTDTWITSCVLVDVAGADRMSRLLFDTCGYTSFFCQYTGLSSESVKAYYSGF